MTNQTLDEFLHSLKRFTTRRARPTKIYSDNGSTFQAASKWLKNLMKEEKLHDYLASQHIKWQFNMSRAPWWGGQFERLIGLVKQSLYKTMGSTTLKWTELENVLLDVESTLNNRPLGYVEDDIDMPVLTPNTMILGQDNFSLDPSNEEIEDADLKKRAKQLRHCKERVWSRWSKEYVRALRERHNLVHKERQLNLKVGDVVIIRGDEKNRAHWKLGIVTKLIIGRDGVVRAAQLRAGKSYLERAVQHLYPLELSCDQVPVNNSTSRNDNTHQREKRTAAAIADIRTRDQLEEENSIPLVE